ncbi:MAG: diguanylate cyclase [Lachnospiraceae bacterium]|nr:diguanylate cyclase [Lachnospiraceae bacterium]
MDKYWVVVVDDDVISLKIARNLLKGQNLKVSVVRSGKDLLHFMKKNRPDLIILDLLMPEMDGFETYRHLRDYELKENIKQTPVIFLTGTKDNESEKIGLELGASDYIRKPFDKDIVLKRVMKTIRSIQTIESLTDEASVDGLTGFINQTWAAEKLEKRCAEDKGALVVMDLDNFKLVNDLYGHEMGDQVLAAFADSVRENTREEDLLCRIGGDEFCGFFDNMTQKESVECLCDRLNEELTKRCKEIIGEGFKVPIGVSAGVVFVPDQGKDYQSLFPLADKMLYTAKEHGKHDIVIYTPFSDLQDELATDLEKELNRMTILMEERNAQHAMVLGQDSFTWIYRFIMRYLKNNGGSVVKVLFSLHPEDDDRKQNFSEVTIAFGDVLKKSLRKSDIITQSSANRFFILLTNFDVDDANNTIERILKVWETLPEHENVDVTYTLESVRL